MSQTIMPPFWHPAECGAFILDWDGVLADTRLDFKPLRDKYFDGKIIPLIEAAETYPSAICKEIKAEIRRIEMYGADRAIVIEGARELIEWLNATQKPWAVVSRNCRDSITLAAERCKIKLPSVCLSREEQFVKPAPEALLLAAKHLKTAPNKCVMVGDFIYDLLGARRASIRAILVQRTGNPEWGALADAVYPTMKELAADVHSPKPLIPWEYRKLAAEKGTEHLSKVAHNVYRPAQGPCLLARILDLVRIGAVQIAVDKNAALSHEDWENSCLPARFIEMPLYQVLTSVISCHWPCVSVITDPAGSRLIDVPVLKADELDAFIGKTLA